MTTNYLSYSLSNDYIHDWLVMGPCVDALDTLPEPAETSLAFQQRILQMYDSISADFSTPPNERDEIEFKGVKYDWLVSHVSEDHLLECSNYQPVFVYQRRWAYARLVVPNAQRLTFKLTTYNPLHIWLNGQRIHRSTYTPERSTQLPAQEGFQVELNAGDNDLLVRLESVGVQDILLAFALQIEGASDLRILVPTLTKEPEVRQRLERTFQAAYLDRSVYRRDDQVKLYCPEDLQDAFEFNMRMQKPTGWIYGETFETLKAGAVIESVNTYQLPPGQMQAMLMPRYEVFYEANMRAQRAIPFQTVTGKYASQPFGTYDERLVEGLRETAIYEEGLYSEICKMVFGWWEDLKPERIQNAIAHVKTRQADCLPDLLGLLWIRLRLMRYKSFPKDIKPALDECVRQFNYQIGNQDQERIDFNVETNTLLLYACQILAGQSFPKETFQEENTGRKLQTIGERKAIAWMQQRAQYGFRQWDSNLEMLILGLGCLLELGRNNVMREMAAVLLDQTFFSLALYSMEGAYGSPQASADADSLLNTRLSPASPISRLLFGMGSLNTHYKGRVGLGMTRSYDLPEIIQWIASDRQQEMWGRERQVVPDGAGGNTFEVNKTLYKTPDYLLAAAQDYYPGQHGSREHLWQASMGPDAIVFTNHPACASESEQRKPGFWRGNGVLPRLAQWKDVVLALYQLPADDAMGFTHAYFPCAFFDDYVLEGDWAFARRESAYLALYAAGGLELVRSGDQALRELRSNNRSGLWICQMGRRDLDAGFDNFRQKVLSAPLKVNGLSLEYQTLRGETLSFGWEGDLKVNGQAQPLKGDKRFENLYCTAELPATEMEIQYGDGAMRLNFS